MAKSDVHNRLGFSTTWIGAIDMSFLFMYACGNFVLGVFGDAYNLVMVVSLGLILSSCLYSIIVILSVFSAAEPGLFMIIFGIIGFLQAATYPGTVAIMGKWFSKDIRGKVIGF